jgi:4-amino-4-deoxy-L-arabinose transferase-like glycosyltransferase
LLWLWILVIVLFFTFSAAKQDLYIFPIVPAVAALAGVFISRRVADGSPARPLALRVTAAMIGLLLAVAGAGTFYIFETVGKVYALHGAAFVGAAAARAGCRACFDGHAELGVRHSSASQFRALQACSANQRHDS